MIQHKEVKKEEDVVLKKLTSQITSKVELSKDLLAHVCKDPSRRNCIMKKKKKDLKINMQIFLIHEEFLRKGQEGSKTGKFLNLKKENAYMSFGLIEVKMLKNIFKYITSEKLEK